MTMNGNGVNKDLLKNPKLEWWLSWPVIIIATIFVWPIGIFLIWKRISIDKKTAMYSGKVVSIIGWTFLSFSVIGILACLGNGFKSDDITLIIFFIIAGIALVYLGKKTKKNAEKYKKYITIIINQEITNIDNIAAAIPTSYDICKKDLKEMINKGYFDGAYINEDSREIILPRNKDINHNEKATVAGQENVEFKVVVCKGCGANNRIVKGSIGECEYCGSSIS